LIQPRFIKNKNDDLSFAVFIKNYVNSENNYAKHKFSKISNSKLEILKSKKGRDIGFWTYDVILNQQKGTKDSILINPTKKQLFVFTRVKKYMIGINCPLHDTTKFDTFKNYLITNIDGIVESPNKIDGIKL
jgi:sporulation protein YlmC with PRC-barrel domain